MEIEKLKKWPLNIIEIFNLPRRVLMVDDLEDFLGLDQPEINKQID